MSAEKKLSNATRRRVTATRDRVAALRDSVARAEDAMDEAAAIAGTPDGAARKPRRQGLAREVLAELEHGPCSVTELAVRLNHPRGAVGTALLGLMRDGVAERYERGQYRKVETADADDAAAGAVAALQAELAAAEQREVAVHALLQAARADIDRVKKAIRDLTPQRLGPRWHSAHQLVRASVDERP